MTLSLDTRNGVEAIKFVVAGIEDREKRGELQDEDREFLLAKMERIRRECNLILHILDK